MKILFVTHCNNMGGANRAMLHLMLELRNSGVEPEVVFPKTRKEPQQSLKQELERYGIPFFEAYYFFYRVNSARGWIRYASNIVWYGRILWMLRKRRYAVVHSNSSFTDLGVWIGLLKRIPHVWHLREYGNWGQSFPAFGRLFDRFLTRNTATGVAISHKESEYYLPLFPLGKIRVIYDGVEPRKSLPLAERETNGLYKFCMVGTLCEGKNQLMAVEAMGMLIQEFPNIRLVIIGEGAAYKRILQSRISELGLEAFVQFTGEIDEVDAMLDTVNCGLTLTQNEAFGRVTVEYMLHALPVIVTDSGANPEIVTDGVDGFVIRQNHVEELVEAMRKLRSDSALSTRFGLAGFKTASERFSSAQNARDIHSLYRELTSNGRTGH